MHTRGSFTHITCMCALASAHMANLGLSDEAGTHACECACLCISIHFCMVSYVRVLLFLLCVESLAILLRFYFFFIFSCLFVCVFSHVLLVHCSFSCFWFLLYQLFLLFFFSAGKFCCTRAMLFYCFLPQGH